MAWLVTRGPKRFLSICWRNADGRHHSKPTGTRDRRPAQASLARFEAEQGLSQPATRATGRDLMERRLAFVVANRCQETSDCYRSSIEPMVRAWEKTPIDEWTRAMLEPHAAAKLSSGAWSGRTCQLWLSGCRQWIKWAIEHGEPVPDFVAGFRGWKPHRPVIQHLDVAQVRTLLAAARGHQLEVPIALTALAGMRHKDPLAAQAANVDWRRKVLTVRGSKGHADRLAPIVPLLEEILRRRAPEVGALHEPVTHETHYRHLRQLCTAAGVPVVTWHPLRHSYATAILDAGATRPEVQAALGHRRLASTGVYLHAKVEGVARAAGKAFATPR